MPSDDPKFLEEAHELDHKHEYDACYEKLNPANGNYKNFGPETLFYAARCIRARALRAEDKTVKANLVAEGLELAKFAYESYPTNARCITVNLHFLLCVFSGMEFS